MAVVSTKRIRGGERASKGADGQSRTYRYHVYVDDPADDVGVALESTDLPARGSAIIAPDGRVLRVTDLAAERVDGTPLLFIVTVEAATNAEPDDEDIWGVEVTIDGLPFDENVTVDRDGKPILNCAGMPYPEGLVKTYYDEEWAISFKSREVDPAVVKARRGTTNSDTISINVHGYIRVFDPKTMKLAKARQRTIVGGDEEPHWLNDYVFHIREDTWTRSVVNRGYHKLVGGVPTRITDDDGEPRETPAYLSADGTAVLEDGDDTTSRDFEIEDEETFTELFAGL